MLVALSDLHLTDGTTASDISPDAFQILEREILAAASDRDAREIHLLLIGDIFDLVRTDYWHRRELDGSLPVANRPWNGTLNPATGMNPAPDVELQFQAILQGILAGPAAKALCWVITRLHAGSRPFRVTYVIGNHDRVLHNFTSLQAMIQAAVPGVSLTFAAGLREPRYGVHARHGHEWDPHCHGWKFHNEVLERGKPTGPFDEATYRVMAAGEVVTAELMSGLVFRVQRAVGTDPEGAELIRQLRDVNNLRPIHTVFRWLEWMGGAQTRRYYPALHHALGESLDGVIDSSLGKHWDKLNRQTLPLTGDLIDHLQDVKRLAMGKTFEEFRGRVHTLAPLADLVLDERRDRYLEGAIQEMKDEKDESIQFIFYGHTHVGKHEYLSGKPDGSGRIYVNTGTWLPLICPARDGVSFASAKQITMVFAYEDDEDTSGKSGGASLDLWQGIRRKLYSK